MISKCPWLSLGSGMFTEARVQTSLRCGLEERNEAIVGQPLKEDIKTQVFLSLFPSSLHEVKRCPPPYTPAVVYAVPR